MSGYSAYLAYVLQCKEGESRAVYVHGASVGTEIRK